MLFAAIFVGLLGLAGATPTLLNASEPVAAKNVSWDEEEIIPVSKMGCWKDTVLSEEADRAKEKLAHWGGSQFIDPGAWHGEEYGGAGVWICNCKHFRSDHANPWELDEAQLRIRRWCGTNIAGWLWSAKWQKSISFGTSQLMHKKGIITGRCPLFCLWTLGQPP